MQKMQLDMKLTLAMGLVLTVAMLWPINQQPVGPDGSDKLVHFIAFAALVLPLARTGRIRILPLFIGVSAFGAVIELIQPSFNRSADINDWFADVIGVVLGISCGFLLRILQRDQS